MRTVSVLMSVSNESLEMLDLAIQSVLNQSYSDFECILINDRPDREDLKAYLANLADGRVRIFTNEANVGLVESLNRGLRKCSGDVIFRMDGDDVSYPLRFERQLEYLNQSGLDLIGCGYEVWHEDSGRIEGRDIVEDHERIVKLLKYRSCLAHPSWCVRRRVYERLGGYRNAPYCEDYDFLIRVLDAGFRIGNCPDVLLRYRVRKSGVSVSHRAVQYQVRCVLADAYPKPLSDAALEKAIQKRGVRLAVLRKVWERMMEMWV